MSVIDPEGGKILLTRGCLDEFWSLMCQQYAQDDKRKWKYLAMLALRENAGWPLDSIGALFGHPKGHVTRCLAKVKEEIRDRFGLSAEYLSFLQSISIEPLDEIEPVLEFESEREAA